jgi:hypothetical protein
MGLAVTTGTADAGGCRPERERAMQTCANGHQNPENQPFCGECGSSTLTSVAICPTGHTVPLRQKFCGQCGAPAASPLAGSTQSSSGRWTTDPYDRHQYRYWDGSKWTAHVGDVGSLGVDPPPIRTMSRSDRWIGAVAGVVTVVLLVGAISAILTRYAPDTAQDQTAAPTISSAAVEPPAPATSSVAAGPPTPAINAPPPPPDNPWPVAVVGTPCHPESSNSVAVDGSITYCVNLWATDTYLWSLVPDQGVVTNQAAAGTNPSVALCIAQTGRSADDCAEYLSRPSTPGDGAAPPAAP